MAIRSQRNPIANSQSLGSVDLKLKDVPNVKFTSEFAKRHNPKMYKKFFERVRNTQAVPKIIGEKKEEMQVVTSGTFKKQPNINSIDFEQERISDTLFIHRTRVLNKKYLEYQQK